MLALVSAGCETYYGSPVTRAGWVYAVVGFLVWLLIARWAARCHILRWFLLPVLVWFGQRLGGGGWWLWAVIVVLVYLLPNRIALRPTATSARTTGDMTPWYWRLSSALVWAAIFWALDRALGEALHAAASGQVDLGAPFTMIPVPNITGGWSLLAWFFALVFVLVLGAIVLVLLLLWYALGFVLNAIHELRIFPVVGLAVGFGFAPTVELFGRSLDTLFSTVRWIFDGLGISVLEFSEERRFSNRLWALVPLLGLLGLVALLEPVVRPVLPGAVRSFLRPAKSDSRPAEFVERRSMATGAVRTTLVRVGSGGAGVAATVRWEALQDGGDAVAGLGNWCLLTTENGSVCVASDDGRLPVNKPVTLHRGQSAEGTYYFCVSPRLGSRCALQIPVWSGGEVAEVPALTFVFKEEAPGP